MGNARSRPAETQQRIHIALTTAVTAVVLFVLKRLSSAEDHNLVKTISHMLGQIEPLQLVVWTLLIKYLLKNSGWLLGLNAPIVEHNYRLSFEFGTRILVALDAGFFSAIHLRPLWLREIVSIVASIYYMIFNAQALENTKRFRRTSDIYGLRWEKSTKSAVLRFVGGLNNPTVKTVKTFNIERKPDKDFFAPQPVEATLLFDGTEDDLLGMQELILHAHGGGFMSMSPRHHIDYLLRWAKQIKKPILSINYAKSPERKYPYALNEIYEVYQTVVTSNGSNIGLSGLRPIRIIVTGDSAGGNLVAALTLKALTENGRVPDGVMMTYPALNMDSGFWAPKLPGGDNKLQMSSHIRYIDDRIIDASIVINSSNAYLNPSDRPDKDMLLSPALAPDELLRKFPPVYINTGNRDPLYDDSILFAARLRHAKNIEISGAPTSSSAHEQITLDVIDGFSHGYLHMLAFVPEVHHIIKRSGDWMAQRFRTLQGGSSGKVEFTE